MYGEIPCVRNLTKEEIDAGYEVNTGVLIVNYFKENQIDVTAMPAVLCKNHSLHRVRMHMKRCTMR